MVQSRQSADSHGRRWRRAGILLAGIVLLQVIVYGPSLIGAKLLMPLDLLAERDYYLPHIEHWQEVAPRNFALEDQVTYYEFARRFAAAEFRAGRLPLWNPDYYAGAPFVRWAKYSPFNMVYYALPSPVTLAWIALIKSVVAACGAYLFFRLVLRASFWPAAIGAWCFPLTGFLVAWQGFPISNVVVWLPWLLLATDGAIRRPGGWSGPAVAALTLLVIISGQADTGGQVLLVSGLYAIWCGFDHYGLGFRRWRAAGSAGAVMSGWAIGLLLSAPFLQPMIDYAKTGARLSDRALGKEERPPAGWIALPQAVLPMMHGADLAGSTRIGTTGNMLESSAAAYTGLIATLLVAPLGWQSRRHRSINVFWSGLALLGLGWALGVPGLVAMLRAPPLNLLSHNRFVFATSFAVLATMVVGLEMIWRGAIDRRRWLLAPVIVLIVLAVWCIERSVHLPEPVATGLVDRLTQQDAWHHAPDPARVAQIKQGFARTYQLGAVLCAAALAGYAAVWWRLARRRWFGPILGVVLIGELISFACGINPQSDPKLYYPRIDILDRLADRPAGRTLGVYCLPPNLHESHGLRDIRGYDGVDPKRLMQLLDIARDPRPKYQSVTYAWSQWYVPRMNWVLPDTIKLPPVLSMLNVRYVIFRGKPRRGFEPLLQGPDYWIVENRDALPRVFVPQEVETVADEKTMLALLADEGFHARRVAYVNQKMNLPRECRGTAQIVDEVPSRVTVSVDMQTPGLVVLADLWDKGWQAYRNDLRVPIRRTNHALRGVRVPKGRHIIEFRYAPIGFTRGVKLMAMAGAWVVVWVVARWWLAWRRRPRYGPAGR